MKKFGIIQDQEAPSFECAKKYNNRISQGLVAHGGKIKIKFKKGDANGMSRTLVIQNGWFENNVTKAKLSEEKKAFFSKNISRKKDSASGGAKISLVSLGFIFLALLLLSGICYLYQVNSLTTQGFEIKEIEKNIQTVEKENKQLQIREIELRSMNNIEKATENLNLVNSSNITYIEVAGPVAMK